MLTLDEIESLCTSLRSNVSIARRRAIKDVLEIIEKESHRVAFSAMGKGCVGEYHVGTAEACLLP